MSVIDSKQAVVRSFVTSVVVCVPFFCLAVYLMEKQVHWHAPAVVMLAILGLAAANFALIVFLEHYRARLGTLTLPALVMAVGLVLLVVIAESVNRFLHDFGYAWLYPAVMIYMGVVGLAIFREKTLLLKCHLGFNTLALAVLWGLAAADKVALPF